MPTQLQLAPSVIRHAMLRNHKNVWMTSHFTLELWQLHRQPLVFSHLPHFATANLSHSCLKELISELMSFLKREQGLSFLRSIIYSELPTLRTLAGHGFSDQRFMGLWRVGQQVHHISLCLFSCAPHSTALHSSYVLGDGEEGWEVGDEKVHGRK